MQLKRKQESDVESEQKITDGTKVSHYIDKRQIPQRACDGQVHLRVRWRSTERCE